MRAVYIVMLFFVLLVIWQCDDAKQPQSASSTLQDAQAVKKPKTDPE